MSRTAEPAPAHPGAVCKAGGHPVHRGDPPTCSGGQQERKRQSNPNWGHPWNLGLPLRRGRGEFRRRRAPARSCPSYINSGDLVHSHRLHCLRALCPLTRLQKSGAEGSPHPESAFHRATRLHRGTPEGPRSLNLCIEKLRANPPFCFLFFFYKAKQARGRKTDEPRKLSPLESHRRGEKQRARGGRRPLFRKAKMELSAAPPLPGRERRWRGKKESGEKNQSFPGTRARKLRFSPSS